MKKIILSLVGVVGLTAGSWGVLPNDITLLPTTITLQGLSITSSNNSEGVAVPLDLNKTYTMVREEVRSYMQQREYASGTGQKILIDYNSDGSMSVDIMDGPFGPDHKGRVRYISPTRDFSTLSADPSTTYYLGGSFPPSLSQEYWANGFDSNGGPVGGIGQSGSGGGGSPTPTSVGNQEVTRQATQSTDGLVLQSGEFHVLP